MVKVDGGAIGLLENENALLKCEAASPIISGVLEQSEEHRNRSI